MASGARKWEDGGSGRGEEGGRPAEVDEQRRRWVDVDGDRRPSREDGVDGSRGRPAELGCGNGGVRGRTAALGAAGEEKRRRGRQALAPKFYGSGAVAEGEGEGEKEKKTGVWRRKSRKNETIWSYI